MRAGQNHLFSTLIAVACEPVFAAPATPGVAGKSIDAMSATAQAGSSGVPGDRRLHSGCGTRLSGMSDILRATGALPEGDDRTTACVLSQGAEALPGGFEMTDCVKRSKVLGEVRAVHVCHAFRAPAHGVTSDSCCGPGRRKCLGALAMKYIAGCTAHITNGGAGVQKLTKYGAKKTSKSGRARRW